MYSLNSNCYLAKRWRSHKPVARMQAGVVWLLRACAAYDGNSVLLCDSCLVGD